MSDARPLRARAAFSSEENCSSSLKKQIRGKWQAAAGVIASALYA
jgi:hypothetical protein